MSLINWNKNNVLKFSVDHTLVDEDLVDFPVLLNITGSSGINGFNCSELFTELDYTFPGAIFSGINNTSFNTDMWQLSNSAGISLLNEEITMSTALYSAIYANWYFDGDFDVEIEVELLIYPNTNSWSIGLIAQLESSSDFFLVSRRYSVGQQKFQIVRYISGVFTIIYTLADTSTLCKLRLVREGALVYGYIYNTAWVNLGSYSYNASGKMRIFFEHGPWDGNPSFSAKLKNFKINSGTIFWPSETYPNRFKITAAYPGVQEHLVEEISDEFTGSNGSAVNSKLWITSLSSGSIAEIQNNKLRARAITSGSDVSALLKSNWSFVGNFSIYLTFEEVELAAASEGGGCIQLWLETGDIIQVYAHRSTTNRYFLFNRKIGGVWTDIITPLIRTDLNGKLYIKRSGAVFSAGYAAQNVVTWFGTTYTYGSIPKVQVVIGVASWTNKPTVEFLFNEFIVEYGEVDWNNLEKNEVYKRYVHGEQQQLFCEIENWNQGTKSIQLWVKVPRILKDQPTDILLYYDKNQSETYYTGPTATFAGRQVWDSNYLAVYHMVQSPLSKYIYDSTNNALHGSTVGLGPAYYLDAPVGRAISFTGSNYINLPSNDLFKPSEITISTYNLVDSSCIAFGRIFDRFRNSGGYGYAFYPDTDGYIRLEICTTITVNAQLICSSRIVRGDLTWHTFSASYRSGYTAGYHSNKKVSSTTSVTGNLKHYTTQEPRIGDGVNDSSYSGDIGQLIVSKISRSEGWMKTTNLTMSDDLLYVSKAPLFQFSGYTKKEDEFVSRTIYLYERYSGELVDKCVSNTNGYYSLYTTYSGAHNLICLDDSDDPVYNDLIMSKKTPTELV